MSRVCIFGAGAIGGMMAGALADAGADVSIVARGPHLAAIKQNGMILRMNGEEKNYKLKASDDPADLGEQDYVIVTLKAHSVPAIVDTFKPLLGKDTAIVPAVNGLPWWYFYGADTGTPLDNSPIETVDPNGAQWHAFGPERAIGCVVYPACTVPEPGVIEHKYGNRFSLGEPDGSTTERLETLSKMLIAGGLKAPRKSRLRDEIWIKLWGNCSFNPVSAITGASLDLIGTNEACRDVIRRMMLECKAVGEAVGWNSHAAWISRLQPWMRWQRLCACRARCLVCTITNPRWKTSSLSAERRPSEVYAQAESTHEAALNAAVSLK